ncbi:MAG: hypothetical protein CM1200mP26_22280 [Acidimicrobiales bacterium]|nr:MAG: hypothetical protein CM1200mP26_22280 [Acidimicrobiales bacterium]
MPRGPKTGSVADAAVTDVVGASLVIEVADCVPLALLGDHSVGLAHAGWRGLRDGVLERTIEALTVLDGTAPVSAVIGPPIGPCCYEFGDDDLAGLVGRFGSRVRSKTIDGARLSTSRQLLQRSLGRAEVPVVFDEVCTSCDDRYWSFRATSTPKRQAMVVWLEQA